MPHQVSLADDADELAGTVEDGDAADPAFEEDLGDLLHVMVGRYRNDIAHHNVCSSHGLSPSNNAKY
jgi:hypothetical protein